MPMQLRSGDPPSAKPLSAHDAFRAVKTAATSASIGEEIIVDNIPAEFALQVIFSVEEDRAFSGRSLRASYNSLTGRMLLKPKPDRINDSCQAWLQREKGAMFGSGWLNLEESLLLEMWCGTTIPTFSAPYDGSVKEPDICWQISDEDFPSLAVEVGCRENYQERLRGMDVWVVGSAAQTKVGILIILDRRDGGNSSFVEVLRPASASRATIEPRIDILPPPDPFHAQMIEITRGELFGSRLIPGRDASSVWNLDIARLRECVEINFRIESQLQAQR